MNKFILVLIAILLLSTQEIKLRDDSASTISDNSGMAYFK